MKIYNHTLPTQADPQEDSLSLSTIDWHLLNIFQKDFPLVAEPYAAIAQQLGIREREVLQRLQHLQEGGIVSRVGVVLRSGRLGVSTLAAVEVAQNDLERVAAIVNSFAEVNHNYEREHTLNLWFVVTACSEERLVEILTEIESHSGSPVYRMPMEENYHIDLGFSMNE